MYYFFLIYKVFLIFVVTFLHKFMKKHIGLSIIFCFAMVSPYLSFSQTDNGEERRADLLHCDYKFEQAVAIYKKELDKCTDSLKRVELEKKLAQSENGLNLLEFAFAPEVVARQKYVRKDFFLHYPGFMEQSWVSLPQQLAPGMDFSGGEFPVMQYSESMEKIVFSAPDESGSWNLYTSEKLSDTLWSAPALMNGNITSAGNEIFPVISANGKSLYFSSNGHYGVGGYDLYVCEWDDDLKDWGLPQNMGFPYSSPADDMLFYNTPDGNYSVFASNRNCASDSIMIYVLDFENVPLKKSVTWQEAAAIAKLELPAKGTDGEKNGSSVANDGAKGGEFSEYTLAVNDVRKLQQQLSEALAIQAKNRELYNTLKNEDDLRSLEKKISEQELATMALQNGVNEAVARLQRLEMEFLSKGMFVPEVEMEQKNQQKETPEQEQKSVVFANMALGQAPQMNVFQPEPEIDLSFRITDGDAEIVEMDNFPQGLIYQIQLFTVSKKASVKSLKGLAPVFERKYPSGKYVYSVGLFKTYNDALSNLNKVRKRGFASAMITAYDSGKSLNVKNARILEKERANSGVYQVWIEGYDVLPQEVLSVIRGITEKDIAKTNANGKLRYVIGPFGNEEDAKILATGLKAISDKEIEVEKLCGL